MTYKKGVVGYALYTEARNNEYTMQIIWTPPMIDPASKEYIPASAIKRVISPETPKSGWRQRDIDLEAVVPNKDTATITQIEDLDEVFDSILPSLERLSDEISKAEKQEWKYVGEPLIIEVTLNDASAIALGKTPEALVRRVGAARTDASYPAKVLVDTPAPAPATV